MCQNNDMRDLRKDDGPLVFSRRVQLEYLTAMGGIALVFHTVRKVNVDVWSNPHPEPNGEWTVIDIVDGDFAYVSAYMSNV